MTGISVLTVKPRLVTEVLSLNPRRKSLVLAKQLFTFKILGYGTSNELFEKHYVCKYFL